MRSLKKVHPSIKLVLVIPYFSDVLNADKEYYESMYDDIVLPDQLMGVHYKSAIATVRIGFNKEDIGISRFDDTVFGVSIISFVL